MNDLTRPRRDRGPRPRPLPRPAQDRRAQRPRPPRPARPLRRGGRGGGRRLRERRLRLQPASSSGQDSGGGPGRPRAAVATRTSPSPRARSPRRPAGPFPGDGSNGPDVLSESGVVRSDITTQLRLRLRDGRGRAADDPDEGLRPERRRRHRPRGGSGLRVALRPRGPLLDVRRRDRRRELPARRPGGRRRGLGRVHEHLPGGVLRPLAARPLRGLPEPGRRDQRLEQAAHLAAGAARGRLQRGLRDRRLRGRASTTWRRPRWTPTTSSATATRCSWPR